jgi:hypothetical protein
VEQIQAHREYITASQHTPSHFKVGQDKIKKANLDYDNGEFDAVAGSFGEAFQAISTA